MKPALPKLRKKQMAQAGMGIVYATLIVVVAVTLWDYRGLPKS
jgi:hypothetical protein